MLIQRTRPHFFSGLILTTVALSMPFQKTTAQSIDPNQSLRADFARIEGRRQDLQYVMDFEADRDTVHPTDAAWRALIHRLNPSQGRIVGQIFGELSAIRQDYSNGLARLDANDVANAVRFRDLLRNRIRQIEILMTEYRNNASLGASVRTAAILGVTGAVNGPALSGLSVLSGITLLDQAAPEGPLPNSMTRTRGVEPMPAPQITQQNPSVDRSEEVDQNATLSQGVPSLSEGRNLNCSANSSEQGSNAGRTRCGINTQHLNSQERQRVFRAAQNALAYREQQAQVRAIRVFEETYQTSLLRQSRVQEIWNRIESSARRFLARLSNISQRPGNSQQTPTSSPTAAQGPFVEREPDQGLNQNGRLSTQDDSTLGNRPIDTQAPPLEAYVDEPAPTPTFSNLPELLEIDQAPENPAPTPSSASTPLPTNPPAEPVRVRNLEQLIREAQSALQTWHDSGRIPIDLALFQLEVEASVLSPPFPQDEYHFLVSIWRNSQNRNLEIERQCQQVQQAMTVAPNRRLQLLPNDGLGCQRTMAESAADRTILGFLQIYNREKLSTIEALRAEGVNCIGRALVLTAAALHLSQPTQSGEVLGLQLFSDHIQAVIFETQTRVVRDLMSGEQLSHILGPIYQPALFLHAFLKSQNAISPVSLSELLIANENVSSPFMGVSNRSIGESPESNSASRLLDFDVGRPLPRYAQGEVPRLRTSGVPNRNRPTSNRTEPVADLSSNISRFIPRSATNSIGSSEAWVPQVGGGIGSRSRNTPIVLTEQRILSEGPRIVEIFLRRLSRTLISFTSGNHCIDPASPFFELFVRHAENPPSLRPFLLSEWEQFFERATELYLRSKLPTVRTLGRWFAHPQFAMPQILFHEQEYECSTQPNLQYFFSGQVTGIRHESQEMGLLFDEIVSRWNPEFSTSVPVSETFIRVFGGSRAENRDLVSNQILQQIRDQIFNAAAAFRQSASSRPLEIVGILQMHPPEDWSAILSLLHTVSDRRVPRNTAPTFPSPFQSIVRVLSRRDLVSTRQVRLSRGDFQTLVRRIEARRAQAQQNAQQESQQAEPAQRIFQNFTILGPPPTMTDQEVEQLAAQSRQRLAEQQRVRPVPHQDGGILETFLAGRENITALLGHRPVIISQALYDEIIVSGMYELAWEPGLIAQRDFQRLFPFLSNTNPFLAISHVLEENPTWSFPNSNQMILLSLQNQSREQSRSIAIPRDLVDLFYQFRLHRLSTQDLSLNQFEMSDQTAGSIAHLARLLGRDWRVDVRN